MRRIVAWCGPGCLAIGLGVVGCVSSKGGVRGGAPQTAADIPETRLALGREAFQTGMCFKCHRPDGTGSKRAPDLTDGEWSHCDGTIEGILGVIRHGVSKAEMVDSSRPFAMNPATNFIKDDDELLALAQYVWSLSHE